MCRGDALNSVVDEVFGSAAAQARIYHDLLTGAGIERGLMGPREADRIWERHILNCAALATVMPRDCSVVDVGSGAGLPGVPLSLARPDLHVTLLEPNLRRVTFLHEVVDNLGITRNVDIVRGRAEEHHDIYDVVTARAVGPLKRLIPWILPLMDPHGGQAILLKGSSAQDEIMAVDKLLTSRGLSADVLSVRAHPDAETTTVVRIGREA